MISGTAFIYAFLYLIIFGLIFSVCWWLLDYLAIREPFNRALRVVLVIGAAVVVIGVLLSLVGHPLIRW